MMSVKIAHCRGGTLNETWEIHLWWRVTSRLKRHSPLYGKYPVVPYLERTFLFRSKAAAEKFAEKVRRRRPDRGCLVTYEYVLSYDHGKTGYPLADRNVPARRTSRLNPAVDFNKEE